MPVLILVLSLRCQGYKNTWKIFVYKKIDQAFSYFPKRPFLDVLQYRCSSKFHKIYRKPTA